MNIETRHDLYVHRLETCYSVEHELLDILARLEDDVRTDSLDSSGDDSLRTDLAELIESHREQTETHIDRLETAFERIDRQPATREVPSLAGLVDEKERFNNVILNDELRPPYYIEFLMRLEQHEIVGYESALRIAAQLDLDSEATEPLEANLDDEQGVLETLDSIAADTEQ